MVDNKSLSEFFSAEKKGRENVPTKKKKVVLIMDEVDGMSAGDRGGMQELISLIKETKIPIICICNDRASPKVKSLANYCLDLRFRRLEIEKELNRTEPNELT
jgi:replication factor C subunit 1